MDPLEKISSIISNHSKLDKPLLIYGISGKNSSKKIYVISKQIQKQLGSVVVYSCEVDSYSKFISPIENAKSSFVILEKFNRVWNDKEIVLWASKRKNLIVVALVEDSVPAHVQKFFTVKKYIK